MEQDNLTFGKWLQRVRNKRGMTQKQLGELINRAENTVRNYESGERYPSLDTARRLAEVLQIPERDHRDFIRFARGEFVRTPSLPAVEVEQQSGSSGIAFPRNVATSTPPEHLGVANADAPTDPPAPAFEPVEPAAERRWWRRPYWLLIGLPLLGVLLTGSVLGWKYWDRWQQAQRVEQATQGIRQGLECATESDLLFVQHPHDTDLLRSCWTEEGIRGYLPEVYRVYNNNDPPLYACRSEQHKPSYHVISMDIVELDVERGTATINAQVNWIVRHCYGDEELYCGDGISEYTMDTDATLIRTGDIWKVNHRMEDVVGQYTTDKDYCLANNVPVGSSSP